MISPPNAAYPIISVHESSLDISSASLATLTPIIQATTSSGVIGSFSFLKRPEFYLIRTIEFLLENGADPNKLSDYSFSSDRVTALHSLSWYSQFKNTSFSERFEPVYELLILNGAHISKKSEYEMTPLHYAAIENNADATKYLLSNNAKVSPKDKFGKTPLDYAESGDVIKLLKQNGATE